MENKIKVFLGSIILFLGVLSFYHFSHDNNILFGVFGMFTFFILLIIFECYFRIQHNIDKKFELNRKINLENIEYIKKGIGDYSKAVFNDLIFIKTLQNKNNDDLKLKIDNLQLLQDKDNKDVKLKIDNILSIESLQNKLIEDFKNKINNLNGSLSRFYWSYVKDKRSENLIALVPDVFKHKSVLYIGARPDRTDFLQNFVNAGYEISILEIYKPNVEYFKDNPRFTEVIEGDVKEFNTSKKYDVVFWWHGPEHVEEDKIKNTLKKLESITRYDLVLGCPWGSVMQGNDHNDNPNEEHINFIKTGYFENMGYKTSYFGLENNMGSNIIAFKNLKR